MKPGDQRFDPMRQILLMTPVYLPVNIQVAQVYMGLKGGYMPSDHELVACEQDHEMEYILRLYGKSATQANILDLRSKCKGFKAVYGYAPHNRSNFYRYLETKFGWRKV